MRTVLKFGAAAVAGWVSAAAMFVVTLVYIVNRKVPRYNGYLKGRRK